MLGGDTIAGPHTAVGGERSDIDHDGERPGFASSAVKTLEEKTILERRPSAVHGNGQPLFDILDKDGASPQPEEESVPSPKLGGQRVNHGEKETFGVPTVRSQPEGEHERFGDTASTSSPAMPGDAAADTARATLRKHLAADVGVSPWNMPTPTPEIQPEAFNDPLDEKFWKDMWIAVAVHNVSFSVAPGGS